MSQGGWKCAKCARVNAGYVTTCLCGVSLSDNKKMISENKRKEKEKRTIGAADVVVGAVNISVADEIGKFKKLLDDGTITEEEFAAKKKQLLGL